MTYILDFIRAVCSSATSWKVLLLVLLLANFPRQFSSPILFAKLLANPLRQLRIAVCTAGPHPPGSERNVHRWTSSVAPLDLICQGPSAVCTAAPQPLNGLPKYLTDKMSDKMVAHMSGYMPNRMPISMPKSMPHGRPSRMPDGMSEYMPDNMSAGGDHSKKVIRCRKSIQFEPC